MQSLPFLRRLLLPLPRQLPRPASSLPSPVLGSESSNPTELSATAPVPRAPCVFRRCRFGSTLDIPVYSSVSCTKTSSRAGRPRPLPSGVHLAGPGLPWTQSRKWSSASWRFAAGGPLLGVLSSESESSPRARPAEGEKRSRASRDHLWVQPIPGGALGLATPQIPSALRLGALSCLTPATLTTGHWLQPAPQASVYKGGGRAEPPKTPGGGGRSVLHVRVQNRLQL